MGNELKQILQFQCQNKIVFLTGLIKQNCLHKSYLIISSFVTVVYNFLILNSQNAAICISITTNRFWWNIKVPTDALHIELKEKRSLFYYF